MSARHRVVFVAAASALVACGGGQSHGTAFDAAWVNDNGAAAAAFEKEFASIKVPLGADVAVGVVGKDTLVGATLDGANTWTAKHAMDDRPALAGGVVVGIGGGELFALDAKTGKQLWARPATGSLRGAGDDGETTVVSFMPPTGPSTVLAVHRDGGVVRQIEDQAPIGVPAVVDGTAFLPWQGQYVSAIDLHRGEERARVLLRTQTSRAFLAGGAVFFGEIGATRFDDKIGGAPSDRASTMMLPTRELPGTPRWMAPGTERAELEAGAQDRVKLYARPRASGPIGAAEDRFVATYFRVAIGFDASQGQLAWVHTNDADYLGGAAYDGGFALCDETGKVSFFVGKSGAPAGSIDLGKKVESCLVQADGFHAAPKSSAPPLADQLASAVRSPHAELVTIQKFLLREMASREDPAVTKTLIEIASDPQTVGDLVSDARKQLAARRTGKEFMMEALAKHYDFLDGVLKPPPVAPLADALAAMNAKDAAPLLASHLHDPADSEDDVMHAARALVTLASKNELDAIALFFAHARGLEGQDADETMQSAVESCAEALVKIGGADLVAQAAKDPFTNATMRDRLASMKK